MSNNNNNIINDIDIENINNQSYRTIVSIAKSLSISSRGSRDSLIDHIREFVKKSKRKRSNISGDSISNQEWSKVDNNEKLFWKIIKNKYLFKYIFAFVRGESLSTPYEQFVDFFEMIENNQIALVKYKLKRGDHLDLVFSPTVFMVNTLRSTRITPINDKDDYNEEKTFQKVYEKEKKDLEFYKLLFNRYQYIINANLEKNVLAAVRYDNVLVLQLLTEHPFHFKITKEILEESVRNISLKSIEFILNSLESNIIESTVFSSSSSSSSSSSPSSSSFSSSSSSSPFSNSSAIIDNSFIINQNYIWSLVKYKAKLIKESIDNTINQNRGGEIYYYCNKILQNINKSIIKLYKLIILLIQDYNYSLISYGLVKLLFNSFLIQCPFQLNFKLKHLIISNYLIALILNQNGISNGNRINKCSGGFDLKEIEEWGLDRVGYWLKRNKFSNEIIEIFKNQLINGKALIQIYNNDVNNNNLNNKILDELGLNQIGLKLIFQRSLQQLFNNINNNSNSSSYNDGFNGYFRIKDDIVVSDILKDEEYIDERYNIKSKNSLIKNIYTKLLLSKQEILELKFNNEQLNCNLELFSEKDTSVLNLIQMYLSMNIQHFNFNITYNLLFSFNGFSKSVLQVQDINQLKCSTFHLLYMCFIFGSSELYEKLISIYNYSSYQLPISIRPNEFLFRYCQDKNKQIQFLTTLFNKSSSTNSLSKSAIIKFIISTDNQEFIKMAIDFNLVTKEILQISGISSSLLSVYSVIRSASTLELLFNYIKDIPFSANDWIYNNKCELILKYFELIGYDEQHSIFKFFSITATTVTNNIQYGFPVHHKKFSPEMVSLILKYPKLFKEIDINYILESKLSYSINSQESYNALIQLIETYDLDLQLPSSYELFESNQFINFNRYEFKLFGWFSNRLIKKKELENEMNSFKINNISINNNNNNTDIIMNDNSNNYYNVTRDNYINCSELFKLYILREYKEFIQLFNQNFSKFIGERWSSFCKLLVKDNQVKLILKIMKVNFNSVALVKGNYRINQLYILIKKVVQLNRLEILKAMYEKYPFIFSYSRGSKMNLFDIKDLRYLFNFAITNDHIQTFGFLLQINKTSKIYNGTLFDQKAKKFLVYKIFKDSFVQSNNSGNKNNNKSKSGGNKTGGRSRSKRKSNIKEKKVIYIDSSSDMDSDSDSYFDDSSDFSDF